MQPAVHRHARRSWQGPALVLVIEDDPFLREAMVLELESRGLHVFTASNGEEGLALAREGPRPSLILLDLNMPVMNGWEFRARQLEDPKLAGIPVVVLSARGDADRQARSLGIDAALPKPIDLDRLQDVLSRYCAA
jgi:CheY-like chemotaxis protein